MTLSPTLQKRFFPSYNEIHQTIINEHKKQHQKKISYLEKKIFSMQQAFNLQQEHEQIKHRLLQNYNSSNHQHLKAIMQSSSDGEEKLEKQKQSYLMNPRSSNFGSTSSDAYSLNYCIDEDMEEDNHYQNHLKFKKQVLERDLFENFNYRPDRKKQHQEEYIFKNLYNPRPVTAFEMGLTEKLKVRKPLKKNYLVSENTKEFKENMNQFKKYHPSENKKKMELKWPKPSNKKKERENNVKKELELSSMKKCSRKQANQDQFTQQHEICQKNTKMLKDSYGKYLKELSGTNIIKWRVLGGEREREKDSIRMSINQSGIGANAPNEGKQEQGPSRLLRLSPNNFMDPTIDVKSSKAK